MSEVVQFPSKEEDTFLIGPFEEYRVLVDGRHIRGLTGSRMADGSVQLHVDNRFCGIFSTEVDAKQAAYLIANAWAIGSGYSHAGAESKDHPFAAIAICVTGVEHAE
jgi:hypothetical protein